MFLKFIACAIVALLVMAIVELLMAKASRREPDLKASIGCAALGVLAAAAFVYMTGGF